MVITTIIYNIPVTYIDKINGDKFKKYFTFTKAIDSGDVLSSLFTQKNLDEWFESRGYKNDGKDKYVFDGFYTLSACCKRSKLYYASPQTYPISAVINRLERNTENKNGELYVRVIPKITYLANILSPDEIPDDIFSLDDDTTSETSVPETPGSRGSITTSTEDEYEDKPPTKRTKTNKSE
jgi:hypothetical protein